MTAGAAANQQPATEPKASDSNDQVRERVRPSSFIMSFSLHEFLFSFLSKKHTMIPYFTFLILSLLPFSTLVLSDHAQFYQKSSKVALALSTVSNGSSSDLRFQLSAPEKAGWGAVGIGDRMADSLMFIIYPSSQRNGVTVSVRTAEGHDTPHTISGIHYTVESTKIENSIMVANVICHECSRWSRGTLDTKSTQQAWIWAAGPGDAEASNSQDAEIDQHSAYGLFFMDMTATYSASTAIPTLSSTSDIHVTEQPGSVPDLVIIHAILLAGSFLILFPFGVITLRWKGLVKWHWILQITAATICMLGLIVAIAMSIMSVEYASFNAVHQIIGIVAITVLVAQILFGYFHHQTYKKLGRRSYVSHLHIWTGRIVVFIGMLDAVLGATLAGQTGIAIAIAVAAIIIYSGVAAVTYLCARKKRLTQPWSDFPSHNSSRDVILGEVNPLRTEGSGYVDQVTHQRQIETNSGTDVLRPALGYGRL